MKWKSALFISSAILLMISSVLFGVTVNLKNVSANSHERGNLVHANDFDCAKQRSQWARARGSMRGMPGRGLCHTANRYREYTARLYSITDLGNGYYKMINMNSG